jgi:hypothetical protein
MVPSCESRHANRDEMMIDETSHDDPPPEASAAERARLDPLKSVLLRALERFLKEHPPCPKNDQLRRAVIGLLCIHPDLLVMPVAAPIEDDFPKSRIAELYKVHPSQITRDLSRLLRHRRFLELIVEEKDADDRLQALPARPALVRPVRDAKMIGAAK